MERGTEVTVRAFGGKLLRRLVWEDLQNGGVLICSADGYRRAMQAGEEPLWAGFPAADIVEVHGQPSPQVGSYAQ